MDFIFYILSRRVYSSRELTKISWCLEGSRVEQLHSVQHVKDFEKSVCIIDASYCLKKEDLPILNKCTYVINLNKETCSEGNLKLQCKGDDIYLFASPVLLKSICETLKLEKNRSFTHFFYWGHTHLVWQEKNGTPRLNAELAPLKLTKHAHDLIVKFVALADGGHEKEFHLISDGVLLGLFIVQGSESRGIFLFLQNLNLNSFYTLQQTPKTCVLTCEKAHDFDGT